MPETSNRIEEVLQFAKDGRVWPAGQAYDAREWTTPTQEKFVDDDRANATPLPMDWSPTVDIEHTIDGEDLARIIYRASFEDGLTGYSRHSGIIIENALVKGPTEYIGGVCDVPIRFRNCLFEDGLNFKDTRLRLLALRYCRIRFALLKRAEIDRSIILEHCNITDGLNMRAAEIGGILGLKGSRLADGMPDYRALDLRSARIGSSLFLRNGFYSTGLIDISDAQIGGIIDCGAGTFVSGTLRSIPISIRAKSVSVAGSVFLNRDFSSIGEVDFRGANIGARMTLRRGSFDNGLKQFPVKHPPRPSFAVNLEHATIAQEFGVSKIHKLNGDIGFHNASVATFSDIPSEWSQRDGMMNGKLWLLNSKYDSITLPKGKRKQRKKWLLKVLPPHYLKPGFIRQPWDQMAAVLQASGDYESADELYVEAERRNLRRLLGTTMREPVRLFFSFPPLLVYYIFMSLIRFGHGFGYVRILAVLFVIWGMNVAVFGLSAHAGRMKPAEEEVVIYMEQSGTDRVPEYYVDFNTIVYALDIILPVELGQQSRWLPMVAREKSLKSYHGDSISRLLGAINCSKVSISDNACRTITTSISRWEWKRIPKIWAWSNICVGWLGFILIGAAFAGNFQRHRTNGNA